MNDDVYVLSICCDGCPFTYGCEVVGVYCNEKDARADGEKYVKDIIEEYEPFFTINIVPYIG